MAEQRLNDANVDASLQEMGGETVPQRMRGDGLVDPGLLSRPAASVLQVARAHMIAGFLALEQPGTSSRAPPISAENVEKARRQHGVSFLAAFAHLDVDQHPRAVDGGDPQTRDFPDPQACSISSGQRDTIAQSLNRFQKADDFLGIQDRRSFSGSLPENDPFEGLLLSQGNAIEEPQGACDLVDVRPRMVLCDEMQLVGADLLHAETIGG